MDIISKLAASIAALLTTYTRVPRGIRVTLIAFSVILVQSVGSAQSGDSSSSFVTLHGSVSLSTDLYGSNATPDSAQPGRRPPVLHRLMINMALGFGDLISIPISLILASPEVSVTTTALAKPTFAEFLTNPANMLGFSCIATRIGWAEFKIGSHTPLFSPLSTGDLQLFGAGVDLKPGMFRAAASYGTTQRAIEPDSANNVRGSYRREVMMGRVAIGKEGETTFGVNLIRAHDVPGSLNKTIVSITPAHALASDSTVIVPADTAHLQAQEGFVASTDVNVVLDKGIALNAEVALSSFTGDQRSPEKEISGNPLSALQTTRTSTHADVAGSAALKLQRDLWGITVKGLYIGAGFVPIGYAFMQSDRIEFTVAPSLRLFERKLSLGGSLGQRVNNLSGTKGESTTQVIGSARISADPSDALNISAQYSNFGIRNSQTIDTLKVQTVSQSMSLDPTLTLQHADMTHIITASVSLDEYRDYNVISGAEGNNDTRTLLASYTAVLNAIPLSATVLSSYMENRLSAGTMIIRMVGVTAGYSFFERALTTSLSITASGSTLGASPTDDQIFYKLNLRWHAAKALEFAASVGNNQYTYGNPIPKGSTFRETIVQLSVATQF